MRKIIFFLFISINVFSQTMPGDIEYSPLTGKSHILMADTFGIYKHQEINRVLDSLVTAGGVDSMTYRNDSLMVFQGVDTLIANIAEFDSLFNGNRTIGRVPTAGTNMGTTTFRGWLEWWYQQPYQQPTLTMNALSISTVEVGTSNTITVSGSTTNPCSFTLSSGTVSFSGYTFGSSTSFSTSYTHAPTSAGSTTLTASQNWSETGSTCADGSPNSGTKTSSRTINQYHPFFYGMSATDYSGNSTFPYTLFSGSNKRLVAQGQQTGMTMTGTNQYIYILVPKSWADFTVTSIIDHNGFNVTPSFTAYDVTITSSGLTNNWTQNYKMYKLNSLTTAAGYAYVYNP